MYKSFLIAFLFYCCTLQSQELQGTVNDTYNNPVPYGNVDILNSGKGTYADSLGHFKLFDVKTEDVVVFSSIG